MDRETERDELAELLAYMQYGPLTPPWSERGDLSPVKFFNRKYADALMKAGYRKVDGTD